MEEIKDSLYKPDSVAFEINEKEKIAVFRISGEMDHHSVKAMKEVIDEKLIEHRPDNVIIDLSKVSFTDSAGLGLILGRYTRITEYGGEMSLRGVSEEFMKILRLAGTDKLIKAEVKGKDDCKK